MLLATCADEDDKSPRVGARPVAEGLNLAEMIAQAARNQGIAVERSVPFGTTSMISEALNRDVLDVYLGFNDTPENPASPITTSWS